ncbi:hypothetical protein [Streptomyces sp. MK37H]|uniref:hypothetical protein n=1 Tax=Streptomyces sp. MK37H TaxID=2699117 RepID=UPI001B388AF8|nr:hypothetical protein [Streptomyces sp. MK37H]MBP8532004.1 hypothetical protein [Streptomyces sp. MK37H]
MRITPVMRAFASMSLAVAGLAAVPSTAHAATFVPCSPTALITAITNANNSGGDSLVLSAGCTYTLTAVDNSDSGSPNGLPVIRKNISITGNGSIIERSAAAGTPDFRIFEVDPPDGYLTLVDLTVRNGRTSPGEVGGGVWLNDGGTLRVVNSTITGNVGSDSGGGGIDNDEGSVSVENSTLSGNTSPFGGGMDMDGGTATLTNSRVVNNTATSSGGGIWGSGTLTLLNTEVSGNTAPVGAGITSFATTHLLSSSVDHNTATASGDAGAGIVNGATLTTSSTQIVGNTASATGSRGGGLLNQSGRTATLQSTTVSGNRAGDGGGIYNRGTVNLVASSVFANTPNQCAPPGSVPGC